MSGGLWFYLCISSADSRGMGAFAGQSISCTDNTFKARLGQEMCILPTHEMLFSFSLQLTTLNNMGLLDQLNLFIEEQSRPLNRLLVNSARGEG